MLYTTVNLALQIIRTVFLYSDGDELSVVDCTVSLQLSKVEMSLAPILKCESHHTTVVVYLRVVLSQME